MQMLSAPLSLLLGLLLFSPCLLLLASSPLPSSTWVYFEIRESSDCDSLPVYLHGIVTDRCFPTDEPFFSLWDGENTSKDARSFRVTASLSPPVNNASLEPSLLPYAQDFVLETFSGAECGAESLLSRALLPYAQPSVEPGNPNLNLTSQSGSGSDGDGDDSNWTWSINGCSRSPWNAQQAMTLLFGNSPPTIIDFYSSYTEMTFFNSSASQDTCADFDSPANFSVWRSGMCISLDGESSVMYSCPSPMFWYAPEEPLIHYFHKHSPDCSGNATERSSSMQCKILSNKRKNNNLNERLFTIRRKTCAGSDRENYWNSPPTTDDNVYRDDDDRGDSNEIALRPHNSSTSQPVVRIVVSFAISLLHENASYTLSLPEEQSTLEEALLGLICGTLHLSVEHCSLHSLSMQSQSTLINMQSQLSRQPLARGNLRVSLSNAESSLALLVSVNITLHREDFPVTNSTTAIHNATEQTILLQEMGRSRSWNAFYTSALSFPHPLLTSSSYLSAVETDVHVLNPSRPPPFDNIPPDVVFPNNTETTISSDEKKYRKLTPSALTGLIVGLGVLTLLQTVVVYVSCFPQSWCARLCSSKTTRVAVDTNAQH